MLWLRNCVKMGRRGTKRLGGEKDVVCGINYIRGCGHWRIMKE